MTLAGGTCRYRELSERYQKREKELEQDHHIFSAKNKKIEVQPRASFAHARASIRLRYTRTCMPEYLPPGYMHARILLS